MASLQKNLLISNSSTLYGRCLEWLVMSLMVSLFLEVMIGIVFRSLGQSLSWYDEVASIMLAWLTFYGSALASHKRAHIGCPEIIQKMTGRIRLIFELFAQTLVIIFFGLLAWMGYDIMDVLATDTMTSLSDVPMNFIQSVIPISAVLILISELNHFRDLLCKAGLRSSSLSLSKGA